MSKDRPLESQPAGNTDPNARGRSLTEIKNPARINSNVTLNQVKTGRIAKAK